MVSDTTTTEIYSLSLHDALPISASCSSCAYLVHLSGALRQVFGVCANEWSPSDGRVVSLDHGCGAHSETDAADRKSTRLNSSHGYISYAVFCSKQKKPNSTQPPR